ncbi:hypothetical protein ACFQZW_08940 [Lutibacter aestuarii]|uniref:TonB C-terminal domain-containing protein n=1 Tax=Lutibacter aestuarii TaxID=861111 RepID=A0ABW2Z913_9FLAO|nr:hypothetical protein [uncultured Lutibacter sp.]
MKNVKVLLLAFAFTFGTLALFAFETTPDIPVKEIRSQIIELFDTPEFYVAEDINVQIKFSFDSEGKIVILSVDSKDPEILKYVRKSMNHKVIYTPGETDRVFTMPLRITK